MLKGKVQHVFLIGAKSLGAYGGYETFIDKLTEYHQNEESIKYHVACKANGDGAMDPAQTPGATVINDNEFIYHNSHCFMIDIPEWLGSAQAIYYDLASLKKACEIIESENIQNPIIYIMACRIGPFMNMVSKRIKKMGGQIFLNPDGHEFLRAKWSRPIRAYWKKSEELMVKRSDLIVCDSKTIESYIHDRYEEKWCRDSLNTTYIAYGSEIVYQDEIYDDGSDLNQWLDKYNLAKREYYLVVGRFVPENNYRTMISEFMKSNSKKNFVLITNKNEDLRNQLKKELKYDSDPRIRFVGTVYNKKLLAKIRVNAYGYLHGHEVGGTNPSLLEALGSTKLNLLLDIGFNREVAEDAALYWRKDCGSLSTLIEYADNLTALEINKYGMLAKERIKNNYSWQKICNEYYEIFTK